mmetsp:Transcript_3279/g.6752  ORF Transcript_3279/g.6752 Transcript_3279/m.6752 type:complete len:741 (-) Transcript_3279:132-2354(-)
MSTLARATSIRSIRSIELVCLYLVSVAGFLVSTATLSLDTEDGMGMGMLTLAFGGWALFSNVARAAAALGCREQCLDAPFHSVLTILSQVAQLGLLVQGMLVLLFDRHAATHFVTALVSHSSDRSEQEHGSITQPMPHHHRPTGYAGGYGDSPRFLLAGPHGGASSEMHMHASDGLGGSGGGGGGGGVAGVGVGAHGGSGAEIELGSEATFMGGICLGLAYGLCVALHQLVGLALVRRLSVFGYALNEGCALVVSVVMSWSFLASLHGWTNGWAIGGVVAALAALTLNHTFAVVFGTGSESGSGGGGSGGGLGFGVGVGVEAGTGFEDSDSESSTNGFNKLAAELNGDGGPFALLAPIRSCSRCHRCCQLTMLRFRLHYCRPATTTTTTTTNTTNTTNTTTGSTVEGGPVDPASAIRTTSHTSTTSTISTATDATDVTAGSELVSLSPSVSLGSSLFRSSSNGSVESTPSTVEANDARYHYPAPVAVSIGEDSDESVGSGESVEDEPLNHGLGALGLGLMLGLGTARPESRASSRPSDSRASSRPSSRPGSRASSRRGSRSGSIAGSRPGSATGFDRVSGCMSESGSAVSLEPAVLDEADPAYSLLSASHLEAEAAGEYAELISHLQFGDIVDAEGDAEFHSVASSYTFVSGGSNGSNNSGSYGYNGSEGRASSTGTATGRRSFGSDMSSYEAVNEATFFRGLEQHHNRHHSPAENSGDFVVVSMPMGSGSAEAAAAERE